MKIQNNRMKKILNNYVGDLTSSTDMTQIILYKVQVSIYKLIL